MPGDPPPQEAYTGGQPGPDQGPPPEGAPDQGPPPDGSADAGDVDFQTFYNNLSSQGDWVQTDNYGYVWQPNVQDPDWRPYSDGHWVYTDEGWTWVADDSEPWGWATYHYGRWANLDGYGWVWVPGYTWAPAWVSWRYGGGYCGWAPLPPDTFIGIDFGGVGLGFHIGGDCDTAYDIGPGYYNFIQVGYLGSRNYRGHYANRNNNFVIINNTRNVTNINVNNQRGAGRFSRVSVGGPNIATVNAQSSTPVQRVHLERSSRVGNASLSGNRLAVFAPQVQASGGTTFRPSHVAATVHDARVNPGASISDPLRVNSRVGAPAATSEQIAAARNAHFSSTARVATPSTQPSAALTRPLNSYTPHESHRTTGGNAGSATPATRSFTPAATGAGTQDRSFTGEGASEVHHAGSGTVNHSSTHEEAPVHASPSAATPQVEHSYATPQAETDRPSHHTEVQEYHEAAPQAVQHEEVHPQAQHEEVQHQDFHPQATHEDAHPQPQQHAAPPPPQHAAAAPAPGAHPSGGGGGSGGDGKKNDQQH